MNFHRLTQAYRLTGLQLQAPLPQAQAGHDNFFLCRDTLRDSERLPVDNVFVKVEKSY